MMTFEQYLLAKLAEEGGEVGQMALKTAYFGSSETKPGDTRTNEERLREEVNDLRAVLEMLSETFNYNLEADREHIERKKESLKKYFRYSMACGLADLFGTPQPTRNEILKSNLYIQQVGRATRNPGASPAIVEDFSVPKEQICSPGLDQIFPSPVVVKDCIGVSERSE
ncbi:hypothetical protein [uncultured Roseibium sp.]|uniref:hypothetical protein n=1 Tax=uncultured Roseibium sp. TaxID=1936171 RepID=UPI00263845BE|nr:hypothetical protein [uncultured Roseibium sp.]